MVEMIVDSEMQNLSVPKRFASYAKAYRTAAEALCQKIIDDKSAQNWPNSAVVLMLAAHAVELFLKSAISHRRPNADLESHDIDKLHTEYCKHFSEQSFSWAIPFKVEYLGFSEAEIKSSKPPTPPSILFRYPVDKNKKEWKTSSAFIPATFLRVLEQMKCDFERIESQLT